MPENKKTEEASPESITDGPGPTRHEIENFNGTAAECLIPALDALDELRHSGDLRKMASPEFEKTMRAKIQSADTAIKFACLRARIIAANGGDLGPKQVAE